MRRVVITGLGCVSPIGNSVEETWNGIKNNKCGVNLISKFDTTDFKVKVAAEVKDLKLEEKLDPKAIRTNDLFTAYARIAANEAMADSGLNDAEFDHSRFGCVLASGFIITIPQGQ